jgi:hypothetical protein
MTMTLVEEGVGVVDCVYGDTHDMFHQRESYITGETRLVQRP